MNALDVLMRELGTQLGMDHLRLDASGCCAFDFDDLHTELRHVAQAGVFNLCASLGRLPAYNRGPMLREIAMANLDPAGLGGCHFAVANGEDELMLVRTVDAQAACGEGLVSALRQMVAVGRTWKGRA